eukprot:5785601-Amphidinium_carterae.1
MNDGRVWVENHPDIRTSHHNVMVGAPFSAADVDFAITTKQYVDGDVENILVDEAEEQMTNDKPWVGYTKYVLKNAFPAAAVEIAEEENGFPAMP